MRLPKITLLNLENADRQATLTLTSKVYKQLRTEIIGCQLQPNEKLRLAVLQQRLGVGMSAIREALSRLAAEGLVWAEDQRGFRVSPVSKEDLVDLTQVRIQIEQLALKQSIEQGDITWEANLLAAYHQLSKSKLPSSTPDDVANRLHRNFHDALVAACGSHWLQYFREVTYAESERYRSLASLGSRRKPRDIAAEHKALFDAALRRDTEAACKAVARHFSTTAELALEAQVRSADSGNGTQARPSMRKLPRG